MSQAPDNIAVAADKFIRTLSGEQKIKAQISFDQDERYNWHFFPKNDRKGIPLKELNATQRNAAMHLLQTALSDTGYEKTKGIIKLEGVLKQLENRSADDTYRDPGQYYFLIFGEPSANTIWSWRFEGHHLSFTFSSENNKLIAATPSFMGSNPAIVLSGPEKGMQVLKDEADLGFEMLHSLNNEQLQKAVFDNNAPNDIITFVSRKALINDPAGITYAELNTSQQKIFFRLLSVYIHRYTKLFAAVMMKEIENAGLKNTRFAWAGSQQPGKPHYYRIIGPTIIIEYDNSQNNANHVHTVLRDLKNDFGGDELVEHYKKSHR